jgi:hypothetical protein
VVPPEKNTAGPEKYRRADDSCKDELLKEKVRINV